MFEKIENSYHLARQSFALLRMDKELLLFPVLSAVAALAVLALFVGPLVAYLGLDGIQQLAQDNDTDAWIWKIGYTFAMYFCTSFVTIFCNAALIGAVMMRLGGKNPTVGDGLRIALARLGPIFGWSLVAATVGLLLNVLKNRRNSVGARVGGSVLGAAWAVATYLAVPVIVVEGLGPWAALKRSAGLLKKTWGEQIIGNLGLGAFFAIVSLVGTLALGGLAYLLGGIVPAVIVGAVFLAVIAVVSQALSAIYRASVYSFTTGKPLPAELSRDLIESAFVPVSS